MEAGGFHGIPKGRILEDDNLRIMRVPEICQGIKTRTNENSEKPDRTNMEMLGYNDFLP